MTSWVLQRITAVLLILYLLAHMWVLHYPPYDITFQTVLDRLMSPAWKLFDITFLAVVLFHALNGTWSVLMDFAPVQRYRTTVTWMVVLVGIAAFVLGAPAIWAFS
ncbi:MAG: succinate dehydrogenase, hydrophobic membrane anchor protein, partial [Anaerolineae bacterium]